MTTFTARIHTATDVANDVLTAAVLIGSALLQGALLAGARLIQTISHPVAAVHS